jgi:UTP:GlnB (protein PII) uridylyltransferase
MKYGKNFEEISREAFSPSVLLELSKKLSPELFAKLMSIMLRLATLGERVRDVWKVSAEEKKKIANEIKGIAEDLKSFLHDIEVRTGKGTS